ncbi:MAG: hypothetical protein L0Z62_21345 [Gemmataceae bacterium]|nr:hypothetical protein [Gemmataceae bacterium]
MNFERWVDPRVVSVRLPALRAYLEDHGWVLKPFPRRQVLKYEGPLDDEGQPIFILAPSSEDLIDYRQGVVDIITTLSVLEDRHPVEILNDILNQGAVASRPGDNGGAAAPAEGAARP